MAPKTRSKAAPAKPMNRPTLGTPTASTPTELVNPLRMENWPQEPRSDDEFTEWMRTVTESLQTWLNESRALAQDESTKTILKEFTRGAKAEWQKHKVHTDVQTGDIYDKTRQGEMEADIQTQKERRAELHETHLTWQRFVEYRTAQAAWEDFLYYQNVWNRKGRDVEAVLETEAERKAAQHGGEKREASAKSKGRIRGTNRKGVSRMEVYPDGAYLVYHIDWLRHIIKIFKRFHLGYRKRMPQVVGPDNAHRYTMPPRRTTPYAKRERHLEERFPSKKRKVIDLAEVEEDYRRRSERQKDNELGRKDGMTPIEWQIDQTRFEEVRDIREGRESAIRDTVSKEPEGESLAEETRSRYAVDRRTLRLLPKEHLLHHGSAEISSDWPTSYESASWGKTINKTGRKGVQSYGLITYSDEDDDEDEERIKKLRLPQYRKEGDPELINKPHKRRYVTHTVRTAQKIFVHDRNDDGTVVSRARGGKWRGHSIDGEIVSEEFSLDANGERIEDTRGIGHNIFTNITVKTKNPLISRRARHEDQNVTGQLSEDEDERHPRDPNFNLSGDANPDQMGELNDDGSSTESAAENEESDDEGDLFRQSYEECSECPFRRQARQMLADLHEKHGPYPHLRFEEMVPRIKDGMRFEEMEAEYLRFLENTEEA